MTPTLSPQEFVAKWRHATLKERSAAQSHFNDLCALLGQPTPAEADPAGRWFTFEAGAGKTTGGQGWADVWKRGYFAWEYKGKHADLDKAYQQLLQYRESLQNPPLLIVSDIDASSSTPTSPTPSSGCVRADAGRPADPRKLDILRKAFTDPDKLRPGQTTEPGHRGGRDAVRPPGRAPAAVRRTSRTQIAHFLIRLLFCLFAEDMGLLPNGLFTRLVTQPHKTAGAVSGQLRQLFAAMASGGLFGCGRDPHFDGGLFNDDGTLDLDSDSLHILAEVSGLDWSSIEPSIFGTLFERSLDPDKRSQLGAHYTERGRHPADRRAGADGAAAPAVGEVQAEAEAKAAEARR